MLPKCQIPNTGFVFCFCKSSLGANEILNVEHIFPVWWPCLGSFQFLAKNARVVQISKFDTFPCTWSRPVCRNKPPFASQLRMLNAYREECPVQAAKALKKAMESGNVEVLKEAIAAAKAEKVSPEAGNWQWGFVLFVNMLCWTKTLPCKNRQLVGGGCLAACMLHVGHFGSYGKTHGIGLRSMFYWLSILPSKLFCLHG